MSSTTKTNKLGLSQFLGTDVPDWRTDYNSDMGKIDKEFQDAEENILDTAEEIKANTYEKKYAGASGVQELFSEVNDRLDNENKYNANRTEFTLSTTAKQINEDGLLLIGFTTNGIAIIYINGIVRYSGKLEQSLTFDIKAGDKVNVNSVSGISGAYFYSK